MTVQKDEQVSKRVSFTAKDDAQQIATGIVMVPNAVDLQGDWETPETIQRFAEQFANFEDVGEADGGVMHAAWPSDHTSLERNEVLEKDTEIGGQTAPEGAWVQSWKFNDEELWELVSDGILEGYSIGAVDVEWSAPMEQDELPDDVTVPDALDEDEPVYELRDGVIREVSAVDIPAVPDAMILDTKAEADKRLADHLGNRDGFVEEALERGHSEEEAERLWSYLNRAADVEGAGEPGTKGRLRAAGKAFIETLTGSDDDGTDTKTSEAPDSEKEGRTLSTSNQHSLYATIDASLDILQDAGVDHGMTRFTDREDTAFDLSEHSARTWSTPDEDEEEETDVSPVNNAAGGETPDDTNMSDNDNEPPEWAKELQEQIDEQSERIDAALDDEGGEKSAEDPFEDAPEWAKSLKEEVDKQAERVDAISKQTGAKESQQLGGAEKTGDEGGLDDRAKFFTPESKRRA